MVTAGSSKILSFIAFALETHGAGDENRTRVLSLGSNMSLSVQILKYLVMRAVKWTTNQRSLNRCADKTNPHFIRACWASTTLVRPVDNSAFDTRQVRTLSRRGR